MRFSRHIVFYAGSDEDVLALVAGSDGAGSARSGGRVLKFRDKPGRYVIQTDYDSWEDARVNNNAAAADEWAARVREVAQSEVKYEDLDVIAEF